MDDPEIMASLDGEAVDTLPAWWMTTEEEEDAMAAVASPDAERALIGNALAYPDILDQAMADVTADMFTVEAHRAIWRILKQRRQKKAPIDPITGQQTADRLGWREII